MVGAAGGTAAEPSFYVDLHVHSKYSRACSRDCDLEHLAWWAARKGIRVVGTGDFTHPAWERELAEKLVPAEPGLFRLAPELERDVLRRLPASCRTATRFMLSTEISTIYKKGEKTRKVHHLLYAPDREAAGRITAALARIGNLAADGRPILGLDSRHLLEITLQADPGCYLVPAHVWTPWFAVLGSKSGFDAVEDCYGDLADEVFALETGLSADPEMFWRISGLDRYRLVSNSDAHSPPMLGREATALACDLDYFAVKDALRTGEGYTGTVEFFPEEGKYHLDGHRACGVRFTPEETKATGGACPACGRPLTVGVLHRVDALADREQSTAPETGGQFRSFVALPEIVGEILGVGPKSKAVATEVGSLVERLGPELGILGEVELSAIADAGSAELVEAIGRLRRGEVLREAGFDGEYGVIRMFSPGELAGETATLFDLAPPASSAPADPSSDDDSALFAMSGAPAPASGQRGARAAKAARRSALGAAAPGPGAAAVVGQEPGSGAAGPLGPPTSQIGFVEPAGIPSSLWEGPRATLEAAGLAPTERAGASVLDGLDPDQRAAASVASGPLVVLAGPGTGKTRMLVHAIAHRVRERAVPAGECLAVTFTRRAADELVERLAGLLGDATPADGAAGSPEDGEARRAPEAPVGTAAGRVTATTFHGLGLLVIREQHTSLARGPAVQVADAARVELLAEALGDAAATVSARAAAARRIGELKRRRALGEQVRGDELAGVLARYDAALREHDLVDLDDLLALPLALLTREPELAEHYRRRFRHVWVDEYQDVDEAQYRLLRVLCPPDGNLCVVGDPDQAIYSFRGADVGYFLRFEEDFPTARRASLSRNYRSTGTIVAAARSAIAPATFVPDRELVAVHPDGPDAAPPAGPTTRPPARERRPARPGPTADRVAVPGPAGGPGGPPVLVRACATEAEEALAVVDTIEEALGGTSFHVLDSAFSGQARAGAFSGQARAGGLSGQIDGSVTSRLSFADVAVLYRTARQAEPVMAALARRGLPFQRRSHGPLADAPGVAALLAELRARRDGAARSVSAALRDAAARVGERCAARGTALAAVLADAALADGASGGARHETTDASGLEDTAEVPSASEAQLRLGMELLAPAAAAAGDDLAGFLTAVSLATEADTLDPRADRISLLTLHAAKGLEFGLVIIVGCEDGLLPMTWGGRSARVASGAAAGPRDGTDPARGPLAEERRLFFVGITRARGRLVLSHVARRPDAGRAPSPFLADLDPALLDRQSGRPGQRASRPRPQGQQLRLL
ncbi:UvrD-helicase domain-containing protein [Frankia sp. CNm7]|uniref:DNA 3'-5' helicase n=1 Tax=Frankia nepalensis TaxID=1836974 RepID=A0A937RJA1_9ACTN|nr:UvrD-helicase domain-containing protein [Frankia nepalensis]MBL7514494.1 UvrD-helicase domain-containing protein [Frankia nepalensis]MBL7523408.1 UvrD-helicase domain-containing protein [Frankia nepalensis]MBL7631207.1 UvrD-helicase domain-containing protein [Frankia nepalensis]